MIPTLKSEFRKLLSIRSTYILVIVTFALISLFAYLGTSASKYDEAVCSTNGEVMFKTNEPMPVPDGGTPEEACGGPINYVTKVDKTLHKEKVLNNLQEAMAVTSLFVAIVVVLLMAHEFRYNTINYTLTNSNSRSKVLLSKIVVSAVFTVVVTLLAIGVSVAVTQIAISAKDLILPAQDYNWTYVLLRHLGYMLINTLFFLGVIVLLRNLVAGIVAIFLLPTINQIGGMLLMSRDIEPTKILPFSAIERFGNVMIDMVPSQAAMMIGQTPSGPASVATSGMVALAYLAGLWVITWVIFLRRDAN